MKASIAVLILALTFSPALLNASDVESYAHNDRQSRSHGTSGCIWSSGNVDFNIKHGSIIMTKHGRHDGELEITKNYELYLDGDLIETSPEQKKLVKEYYDTSMDLVDEAKELGIEGAKIGLAGAGIGLKAFGGIFKAIFTDYEFEDLEEELDEQSEKLEERASELEERAGVVEDLANDLEGTFHDMVRDIPELHDWKDAWSDDDDWDEI
jgi:hypothetical protein